MNEGLAIRGIGTETLIPAASFRRIHGGCRARDQRRHPEQAGVGYGDRAEHSRLHRLPATEPGYHQSGIPVFNPVVSRKRLILVMTFGRGKLIVKTGVQEAFTSCRNPRAKRANRPDDPPPAAPVGLPRGRKADVEETDLRLSDRPLSHPLEIVRRMPCQAISPALFGLIELLSSPILLIENGSTQDWQEMAAAGPVLAMAA